MYISHVVRMSAKQANPFNRTNVKALRFLHKSHRMRCVALARVRSLTGNRLELSTFNTKFGRHTLWRSLDIHWSGGQKVKGQGHTVTKTVTVAWLAAVAASVLLRCRHGTARRTTA